MSEARWLPTERVIGAYDTGRPGPSFLVIGGIHGNEPAGARAARRVAEALVAHAPPLRGRFLALAGNLAAMHLGRRFGERDLNRVWSDEHVAALRAQDPAHDSAEQREQRALLEHIDRVLALGAPAYILDLHSTSADGAPFSVMSDTLQNRRLAFALPIPIILGLEEVVRATLLEYYGEMGYIALAVEGGQHADVRTVEHHESILWMAMVAGGLLDASDVPDWSAHEARLRRACDGLPSIVETTHRHAIRPEDGFRMEPGYANFDPVRAGDLLANDAHGGIRAPRDGLLLMPLYQGQGDDGFFLARRVNLFWLQLSALLRRLRLDRMLPLLPGVRRHPLRERELLADRRVTRWLVLEVFHLLGFRRDREEGRYLVFSRRPDRPLT